MAMFMESDFSVLKQNQQGDMVDFKALFGEQDRCDGEFTLMPIKMLIFGHVDVLGK